MAPARNRWSWENRQNPSDSRWSLRRRTSRSALGKSMSPRGFQFEQNASTLTALSGALLPLWCRSTPQLSRDCGQTVSVLEQRLTLTENRLKDCIDNQREISFRLRCSTDPESTASH
ncbi:hypothetical protein SRHO_G00272000 [Serrasalmus rhombeus]